MLAAAPHTLLWQAWWFYLIGSLLVLVLIVVAFRFRLAQVRKQEAIKTELNKIVAETKLEALRAQMNPHFIFNSLNSINRYIVKSDRVTASNYLTKFGKLIRLILEGSANVNTSLEQELELLKLYLEMESLRFNGNFSYSVICDDSINAASTYIPAMVIQPYIENAIWHGLMHKEEEVKQLALTVSKKDDVLVVTIEDNGIGRARAAEMKSRNALKQKSYGMKVTGDRISITNRMYGSNAMVEIEDLQDREHKPTGTKVTLQIPVVLAVNEYQVL
jgi:LytS/YehU family sensor histidine kinase